MIIDHGEDYEMIKKYPSRGNSNDRNYEKGRAGGLNQTLYPSDQIII
jgi:hypothetical protein